MTLSSLFRFLKKNVRQQIARNETNSEESRVFIRRVVITFHILYVIDVASSKFFCVGPPANESADDIIAPDFSIISLRVTEWQTGDIYRKSISLSKS
jgi:hypothetical protein